MLRCWRSLERNFGRWGEQRLLAWSRAKALPHYAHRHHHHSVPSLPRHSQEANYYGSLTQAGTVSLGLDAEGQEVFVPFRALLPMVSPDDLVFDGGRGPGRGWGGVGGVARRGPAEGLAEPEGCP